MRMVLVLNLRILYMSPFNSLDAVKAVIDSHTCAVILEPIQGEGGSDTGDSGVYAWLTYTM